MILLGFVGFLVGGMYDFIADVVGFLIDDLGGDFAWFGECMILVDGFTWFGSCMVGGCIRFGLDVV